MSKILTVFGATGQQGSSVISYVLNSPKLASEFKIRGVARNISNDKSKELISKGVEMVSGNLDDEKAVESAISGAHSVVALTFPGYSSGSKVSEIEQVKFIGRSCVKHDIKFIIYSTSDNAQEVTKGKLSKESILTDRALCEAYLRSLPIKSAYYNPGSFMQNFQSENILVPVGDNKYLLTNIFAEDEPIPLIDVAADTGKFVGRILEDPEKYEGKVLAAAYSHLYTYPEIADIMSKVTGKEVMYKRIPDEEFKKYLPPLAADMLMSMFTYFARYGYYGPDMKQRLKWSTDEIKVKLTSLEEYLKSHPV